MVWGQIAAAAIPAIASFLSSESSDDATAAANQQQIDWNREQLKQNLQFQREFAQQGVQWRVEDANRSGIHPLAALGAQTASFTPQAVGISPLPLTGRANFLQNLGQDIGRAIRSTQTAEERRLDEQRALARQEELDRINKERHRADLVHMNLENELLASQIKRLQVQNNPSIPGKAGPGIRLGVQPAGKPVAPDVIRVNPSPVTSHSSDTPGLEAGQTPGFKKYRLGGPSSGFTMELPGQQMSESLESVPLLAPFVTGAHNTSRAWDSFWSGGKPPEYKLPPGSSWKWNRWQQQWEIERR